MFGLSILAMLAGLASVAKGVSLPVASPSQPQNNSYEGRFFADAVQVPPRQIISSMCFSCDGRTIATVRTNDDKNGNVTFGQSGKLQSWNCKTGELLWTAKDPVDAVQAYSPNDKEIAVITATQELGLYSATSGRLLRTLKRPVRGQYSMIDAAAFSADGKYLAMTGRGYSLTDSGPIMINAYMNAPGFVSIWKVLTGQLVHVMQGYQGAVESVAFSADDNLVCGGVWPASARIWNIQSGQLLHTLTFGSNAWGIHSVAFSPNGKTLATGSGVSGGPDKTTGEIRFWDTNTGGLLKIVEDPGPMYQLGQFPFLTFSPDGKFLACVGNGQCFFIWNTASEAWQTYIGYSPIVQNSGIARFIPKGIEIATQTSDGRLQISLLRNQ